MKETAKKSARIAISKAAKVTMVVLLVLADILMGALLIVLFAIVAALAAAAVAFVYGGVVAVADLSVTWVVIPEMIPYISRLLLGIMLFMLALLAAGGTEFCRMYVTQILRAFIRWHKNALQKDGETSPPLPLHPWVHPLKRKIMSVIVQGSIIVFFIALVLCLCSIILTARSLVPWQVWHWFD